MKKGLRSILSIVLVLSMLFGATIPAFAAEDEEYICEIRLIYAEDYEEALAILEDSEFSDYKLLEDNLNEDSEEIGVWLAYKSTTNIEDAITDIAVMQMDGGYIEGNYQEMIANSYQDYVTMGEIYLQAIDYFVEAYDEGYFLAEAAFRQLNFYDVVSEGIPEDKIPDFEGERLGDIFYDGIDENELATMFMEGNTYVLSNVRSLLAMGVAYNADGKTYYQKVADSAALMNENPKIYDDADYDELAMIVCATISTVRDMFKELGSVENELDYTDEEMTDNELNYAEAKSLADRMREVDYLNGKTLYQFCVEYKENYDDFSNLYPLVDALNDGQVAMTKVSHYYDVLRYSMSDYPEEILNAEIDKLEETYSVNPVNVYLGVDRTIYYGTYALTSAAYRTDSYSEMSFEEYLNSNRPGLSTALRVVGGTGTFLMVWAICRTIKQGMSISAANKSVAIAQTALANSSKTGMENFANSIFQNSFGEVYSGMGLDATVDPSATIDDVVNLMFQKYVVASKPGASIVGKSLADKLDALDDVYSSLSSTDQTVLNSMSDKLVLSQVSADLNGKTTLEIAQTKLNVVSRISGFTATLYIVGGIMMLYSAIRLGVSAYNYYHPEYSDVPIAMVDLIETVDGDRYIKYDVVFSAETNKDGAYEAADLNAFAGQRWNALYYTKSYEAGKPLLADEFVVSNKNNKPEENYAPVHRFGEVVCYDLNKYNFEGDTNIYLSIKQSEEQKSAVADVPTVVGSMMGSSIWILAGGIGAIVGIGGTLATQEMMKKKKPKKDTSV